MRTNIDINNEIMEKALLVSGLRTKREVVERALIEYIATNSRKNILELKGKIKFSDGYDYKATRRGFD